MDGSLLLEDSDTQPDLPWRAEPSAGLPKGLHATATWGGSSTVGLVREHNEDRFGHEGIMYAVADGMGRRGGGSEAAESTMESAFRRGPVLGVGAPLNRWRALVQMVNMDVRARVSELGFTRAGSTLTMAAVEPGRIVVAHVGDSRLYVLQGDTFCQRTVDHILENELASSGTSIEQAKAKGLPLSGLTSYVGQSDRHLRVDVDSWSPEPGTKLLLCSDGVYRYLKHELIYEVVAAFPPAEAAKELTRQADATGGRDNATALVLEL